MIFSLDIAVGAGLAWMPLVVVFGAEAVAEQIPPAIECLISTGARGILNCPFAFWGNAFKTHWIALLFLWILSYILWNVYTTLQTPLNLVREPRKPRKSRGQRPNDFPPPFPNGWYVIAISDELKKGQAQEVQVCGKHLVLFRGMNGEAGCLNAFCPHLGANMGVAGEVRGNCLKCCFHGWEFDKNGKCEKIPGTASIPVQANAEAHTIREVNRLIFLWHHAEDAEPWELEELPYLKGNTGWYTGGRTWCHVNAHIQELPENGPDAAHLNVLHQPFVWEVMPSFFTHKWWANWKPDEKNTHYSDIHLTQGMCVFGRRIPGTFVDVHIHQMGPGIVQLELNTPLGKAVVYECVTPHRSTTQIVRHVIFCSGTIPRFVGKFIMWAFEAQFQRDVPIWETKKYEPKPIISKADGPILAFRRWFSQFYSASSISFPDAIAKENMMDW